MHAKSHHFIIPTVAVTVAVLGAIFTELGMAWYLSALTLPSITPPDWIFPIVWTVIYIMVAGAAFIIWHEGPKKVFHLFATPHSRGEYRLLQWLFAINAFLNLLWILLFFTFHAISLAAVEIVLLEISIIAMVAFAWKISKIASYILMPYAAWVLFAAYFSMRIAFLN
jgi:translocator protein